MHGQGRLGDRGTVAFDAHGCPGCPHPAIGPAVGGSPDVNVNGRPALRAGDMGVHGGCCGSNTWRAQDGAATVFINGRPAHRLGDAQQHCGGSGRLIEASPDVIVGGSSTSGVANARDRVSTPDADGTPQAEALRDAAQDGVPFCEPCDRRVRDDERTAGGTVSHDGATGGR